MLPHVIITLLSSVNHVISGFECHGTCYSGSFPKNNQIIKGKHLRGYSYKNITTDVPRTCFSSCINDCRCKAFQMKHVRCEVLDEDKTSKAADFADATGYVYYDLQQTFYKGVSFDVVLVKHVQCETISEIVLRFHVLFKKSHMVYPAGSCYNGCCRSEPCINGGTCVEHCEKPKIKFSCKCPVTYRGTVCEKREFRSCIEVLTTSVPGTMPANGTYIITRRDTKTTVPVYCAFERPNQAWTLIESFSLQSRSIFQGLAFHQDHPRNQESHNWNDYRLSLSNMQYIQTKATMFRATCDYQNRDSLTPDFLLGYKKDLDIINGGNQEGTCVKISYMNIKGHEFQEVEIPIFHTKDVDHIHMDSTPSFHHCSFTAPAGAHSYNEDVFGQYSKYDAASRCTATQQSTTQWWLGEQQ